jgi:hypothetical protein
MDTRPIQQSIGQIANRVSTVSVRRLEFRTCPELRPYLCKCETTKYVFVLAEAEAKPCLKTQRDGDCTDRQFKWLIRWQLMESVLIRNKEDRQWNKKRPDRPWKAAGP